MYTRLVFRTYIIDQERTSRKCHKAGYTCHLSLQKKEQYRKLFELDLKSAVVMTEEEKREYKQEFEMKMRDCTPIKNLLKLSAQLRQTGYFKMQQEYKKLGGCRDRLNLSVNLSNKSHNRASQSKLGQSSCLYQPKSNKSKPQKGSSKEPIKLDNRLAMKGSFKQRNDDQVLSFMKKLKKPTNNSNKNEDLQKKIIQQEENFNKKLAQVKNEIEAMKLKSQKDNSPSIQKEKKEEINQLENLRNTDRGGSLNALRELNIIMQQLKQKYEFIHMRNVKIRMKGYLRIDEETMRKIEDEEYRLLESQYQRQIQEVKRKLMSDFYETNTILIHHQISTYIYLFIYSDFWS